MNLSDRFVMRKISYYAVCIGVLCCLFAAIWTPGNPIKFIASAAYLLLVGKWFGLTFRDDKIKGETIKRTDKELNFLNLRGKK